MICVYNENCVRAGSRAFHGGDENEGTRICNHGDHIRVGQTKLAARQYRKAGGAFNDKIARTIEFYTV